MTVGGQHNTMCLLSALRLAAGIRALQERAPDTGETAVTRRWMLTD